MIKFGDKPNFLRKFGIGHLLGCVVCVVLLVVALIFESGVVPLDDTSNLIITIGLLVGAILIALSLFIRSKKVMKEVMPAKSCPKCGMVFSPLLGAYLFCPRCGAPTGITDNQGEISRKNLRSDTATVKIPPQDLKVMPDYTMNPMQDASNNMKQAQNRQALISVICCVVSIGLMILFFELYS